MERIQKAVYVVRINENGSLPKSTKVRPHGKNVRDVIIAHVISEDAHNIIQTQKQQSKLRTSRPRARRLV